MNGNQFFAHLKDQQFREALRLLLHGWQELSWEVRCASVGLPVVLLLVWLYVAAGFMAGLLAAPLGICALIAIARPTPVPEGVAGFVRWADGKRQAAATKGSFFAKWVMRPVYAGLSGAASLTAPLKDPYLRAGTTIMVQCYAVCLTLAVASAAIYLVLMLACIAFTLWMVVRAFSDRSGGGFVSDAVSRRFARYSEPREDLFGHPYTQHTDEYGNPVGRTETREDLLGREYQQRVSQEGDDLGHSEVREDILGNRYTQHINEQGEQTGYSETREDVFGRKYVEHLDAEGNPIGRSEEREDLLGRKYIRHEQE